MKHSVIGTALEIGIIAAGSVIVLAVSIHFGWLSPLNLEVYDLAMEYRVSEDTVANVVVIAIDRASLESEFPDPDFPISRHLGLHAEVTRKLHSAGAKLIVYDVLFDRLGGVEISGLEEFVQAISQAGNVVLGSSIERQSDNEASASSVIEESLCLPVAPILQACFGVGLVDMPTDVDGTIRRCYYGKEFQNESRPSIESFIYTSLNPGDKLPRDPSESFNIDFIHGFNGIPSVSYRRVLHDDDWQTSVREKVALIGLTSNGQVDRFKVPISGSINRLDSKMSGVEIHAHATETLLLGPRIRELHDSHSLVLGALVLSLCVFFVLRLRAVLGVLLVLVIIVLTSLNAILLLTEISVIYPVGEFLAALVILVVGAFAWNQGLFRRSSEHMGRQLAGIKQDLDTASVIQGNLQPVEFPDNDNIEISVAQKSYGEVGGDYYDVIDLGQGRIGILVADVSGKGVPGSLIMANLQGRFRQIAPETVEPNEVLSNLNGLVNNAAGARSMFATLFYGIIDTDNMLFRYANAGHCSPVLCAKNGHSRMISEGGPMIGPFPDMQWENHECSLSTGDLLCLYTDGISEVWDKEKKNMYDEERIASCIERCHEQPTDSVVTSVLESCRKFSGGGGFDDDWTLLVFRIKSPESG